MKHKIRLSMKDKSFAFADDNACMIRELAKSIFIKFMVTWKATHFLVNLFWALHYKEYIYFSQKRQKHNEPSLGHYLNFPYTTKKVRKIDTRLWMSSECPLWCPTNKGIDGHILWHKNKIVKFRRSKNIHLVEMHLCIYYSLKCIIKQRLNFGLEYENVLTLYIQIPFVVKYAHFQFRVCRSTKQCFPGVFWFRSVCKSWGWQFSADRRCLKWVFFKFI